MANREVEEILVGRPASDGAGVKLTRVFGGDNNAARFEPWLMMDEFGSYDAADYIAGFPSHPHRGFETITYMLEGHMEHQDHMGNVGDLQSGDVQWMTAGAGIIHSEMPKQQQGRMRGFQVWLNLPARDKMQPPSYQDLKGSDIPVYKLPGATVNAIAGRLRSAGTELAGAVTRQDGTDAAYLDIHLDDKASIEISVPEDYTVLVYVYEGSAGLGSKQTRLDKGRLGRLSAGDVVSVAAKSETRIVLLSARPLKEPIVQYGPFVMNSVEEIEQALQDYRDGVLAQ
jgi:redox-sensitive bicupin YhaK (pirin superfamily)